MSFTAWSACATFSSGDTPPIVAALIAGAAAVAAYQLPLKLNIVAAIAVAVLLCFWLEGRRPSPPQERVA